jgi:hypothetical protein
MHINLSLAPIVALIAGILILVMPKLLNYIVALYLIFIGLLGLFGTGGSFHFRLRCAAPRRWGCLVRCRRPSLRPPQSHRCCRR